MQCLTSSPSTAVIKTGAPSAYNIQYRHCNNIYIYIHNHFKKEKEEKKKEEKKKENRNKKKIRIRYRYHNHSQYFNPKLKKEIVIATLCVCVRER